jgi:hypothetical protein
MNKRFLIIAAVVLAVVGVSVLLINEHNDPKHDKLGELTEAELAESARKHYGEAPTQA